MARTSKKVAEEARNSERYYEIKTSLIKQLDKQGKVDDFYKDLVNDYMAHWVVKETLVDDINSKGIRYRVTNGNGISSSKPNESVQNLQKETAIMLKILSELKLKEPELSFDNGAGGKGGGDGKSNEEDVSDYL